MKNLIYLLSVSTMLVFTACTGGATEESALASEEFVACADDCQKWCCKGCKATEGEVKCIVADDGSMPCCIVKEETACCCGNAECEGPETCPKHQGADAGDDHNHDHDHDHDHDHE